MKWQPGTPSCAAFLLALQLAAPTPEQRAFSYSAQVVQVLDGDSLTILWAGNRHSIELFGIDLPKGGPAHAGQAQALSARLAEGKTVEVTDMGHRSSDPRLVRIHLPDGQDLAAELLRAGLACYAAEGGEELVQFLEEARNQGLGVWSLPDPPCCVPETACRKVCGKSEAQSKACGASCIQRDLTCHQKKNSACDKEELCPDAK